MIREIEKTLEDVKIAITFCDEVDTIKMLLKVEERLKDWLIRYSDDGK
jgi:hypothetical protein